MTDGTSNSVGQGRVLASRAEIDALSEIIVATIAMATRTRSVAATALLERALATLDDRARAMGAQGDDARQNGFRAS